MLLVTPLNAKVVPQTVGARKIVGTAHTTQASLTVGAMRMVRKAVIVAVVLTVAMAVTGQARVRETQVMVIKIQVDMITKLRRVSWAKELMDTLEDVEKRRKNGKTTPFMR